MPGKPATPLMHNVFRLFNIEPGEARPVLIGLLMFFALFTGYFMLRPVRETMGIAGGVDNLQWLFTGTFLATLVMLPVFGWLASKVPRRVLALWIYTGCAFILLMFAAVFWLYPDSVWAARTFYIWLSVFNLIAISLAWSVLADVMTAGQARRTFALIAGGASVGGLVGPVMGAMLVKPLGHAGLLMISALLLWVCAGAATGLHRWREGRPLAQADEPAPRHKALGGNPFSGATQTLRSPYLMGITLFVLMLASINTFLYFEQARLMVEYFPDRTDQTRVFGLIDATVQALSLIVQVFLAGHLARRLGVGVLLILVPVLMVPGFLALAVAPLFSIFVVVMVVRRVGEYALVRPGREMLYAVLPAEQKYKAKNFIDTVVYRGGDAASGWLKRAIDLLGEHPAAAMLVGALLAAGWGVCGYLLGRHERALEGNENLKTD
ncbi:NTP/NDP exchange transporter [Pseudomonas sp. NPDC089734]|uniref:NTP/NDP exchange transporter n=1 Tax=Pseudomonas sp. NPDC089734 TaxID=3364469 RepID=UPI003827A519